jgi:hypothetical protein
MLAYDLVHILRKKYNTKFILKLDLHTGLKRKKGKGFSIRYTSIKVYFKNRFY